MKTNTKIIEPKYKIGDIVIYETHFNLQKNKEDKSKNSKNVKTNFFQCIVVDASFSGDDAKEWSYQLVVGDPVWAFINRDKTSRIFVGEKDIKRKVN